MFLVGRVLPQLSSCFRNAIKGVACAQTTFPLRNAFKISCLQKVVYAYVRLSFSAVTALVVPLSQCQNDKNDEEERAKRLAQKQKQRQRV